MPELKAQAREVWRLSLPAILTQITTIAMQYIDSAMVGALGANASASIGLVSTSTWLIGGIIGGVSAGFSVQASHRIGGGDDRGARTIVRHGLVTGMLIAVILAVLAALISEPLPRWLHGDEAIRADACAYFLTFALMVPFSQLNSLCASFLQSAGDMVSPSVLNAVMCVLDVFFNALFIPRCGVFGAGLGTASACAVVSLLMAAAVPAAKFASAHAPEGEGHRSRRDTEKGVPYRVPCGIAGGVPLRGDGRADAHHRAARRGGGRGELVRGHGRRASAICRGMVSARRRQRSSGGASARGKQGSPASRGTYAPRWARSL